MKQDKDTGYKAAHAFVDSLSGNHFAPGDPIDAKTLKPSKDADDRTQDLLDKGHIVTNDTPLAARSVTDDGSIVDRFDIREGESVEDARKRAGLAPINLTKDGSAAATEGGKGAGTANTPAAHDAAALSPAAKDAVNEAKK